MKFKNSKENRLLINIVKEILPRRYMYDGGLLVCGMYSTSFFPSNTLKINGFAMNQENLRTSSPLLYGSQLNTPVLGHVQCFKLMKTRSQCHVCVQSYCVKEKDLCFIIYKSCTSIRTEKYMKNVTEKCKNQSND